MVYRRVYKLNQQCHPPANKCPAAARKLLSFSKMAQGWPLVFSLKSPHRCSQIKRRAFISIWSCGSTYSECTKHLEHLPNIELQLLTHSNLCTWHLLPYPIQRHLNILSCPFTLWMAHTYTIHVSFVSRLKSPSLTCLLPFHLHWLMWL